MPILLDTPYPYQPVGAPALTYSQAKIIGFEARVEPAEDAGTTIRVQYGETVDGVWVPGLVPVVYVQIQDSPAEVGTNPAGEYVELVPRGVQYRGWVGTTFPTSTSNLLYAEVALALYQWLIDNGGFPGSVVP